MTRAAGGFLSAEACAALLRDLGQCRRTLLAAGQGLPARNPVQREMSHLVDDIDALACLLTGDRTYFHASPHRTPGE